MPKTPKSDIYDFVMGFVSHSRIWKGDNITKWREIVANFAVEPWDVDQIAVGNPYGKGRTRVHGYGNRSERGINRGIVLKDGETHRSIMTYASKLALSILGDSRGEYLRAHPVGWEDAPLKAPTTTRLLRYDFALPNVYRSLVMAFIDMLLFGTSIVEIPWKYRQREQKIRDILFQAGVELDTVTDSVVDAYDDPCLNCIDNQDFFPDPGQPLLEDMMGVAKRFRVTALQAREKVAQGLWDGDAVEQAIAGGTQDRNEGSKEADEFREGIDQPWNKDAYPDFKPMIAYEYWGDFPWEDDFGSSRSTAVVLNSFVVKEPSGWPLADPDLPFRSITINPVVGRFYGIAPAEVMRYDQDLKDALKILLAEAVIRQVHPPIAYDPDSEIDVAKLRRWQADMPIAATGGPSAVGTLRYDANVFNGIALGQETTNDMRETGGALGVLGGSGFGTKRQSATEAQLTAQNAMDRPELAASLIEREEMPKIGKSFLRRNQQFLSTEGLRERIGEQPQGAWIGDIMGDFDIKFVGSRMAMTRQQKLQAYQMLAAMAATNPVFATIVPWQDMAAEIIGDILELPEVAARISDPQVVQQNLMLQQLTGLNQAGNNNGETPSQQPAGLSAEQAAGSIVG